MTVRYLLISSNIMGIHGYQITAGILDFEIKAIAQLENPPRRKKRAGRETKRF